MAFRLKTLKMLVLNLEHWILIRISVWIVSGLIILNQHF
jgi:hypothetical protein